MSMLKKMRNKPNQVVRLFSNTTKRDGSPLEEANHNLRGTEGEHTLSMYPNRKRCYLEVSRPIYEGAKLWCKGYITLSFAEEGRLDGQTEINLGVITLPDGRTLKVELRDAESHDRRDSSGTYQAYTLEVFGGSITAEDCEAAIEANSRNGMVAPASYRTTGDDAPEEEEAAAEAVSTKLGEDPGF